MKKAYLTLVILVGALAVTQFTSCKPDEEVEKEYTYTDDAKSVFDASCAAAGCHASGSPVGSLANYADAKAMAENGRIVGSIKHEADFSAMPKNGTKLSDDNINAIEQWIIDGLKE